MLKLISTPFSNERGIDIDPMILMNKPCYATAAIKIESIFIGAKISLQVKVYEAEVKMIDNAPRRLLRRPVESESVVMESHEKEDEKEINKNDDDDDDHSVKGSDDEDDDEEVKTQVQPVVVEPQPVAAAAASSSTAAAKAAPRRAQRKS